MHIQLSLQDSSEQITRLCAYFDKHPKVWQNALSVFEFPLAAEDIAECIRWSVMLPAHINIDSLTIRPVAQAAAHKVHRIK